MRDSLSRIFLSLASADASRSDLRELLKWIELNGIDRASEVIRSLQTSADVMHRDAQGGLSATESFEDARRSSERQLALRIERLMLESGLTKAAAVKATTNALRERGYSLKSLPESNKLAFRAWIERLLKQIPAEDLLSVATTVRNYSAHGLDWPLRRDKP